MSDRERVRKLRVAFLKFRAELSQAHGFCIDPLVAGDLMRAWHLADRLKFELEEAANDAGEALMMTTTEPTTAEET